MYTAEATDFNATGLADDSCRLLRLSRKQVDRRCADNDERAAIRGGMQPLRRLSGGQRSLPIALPQRWRPFSRNSESLDAPRLGMRFGLSATVGRSEGQRDFRAGCPIPGTLWVAFVAARVGHRKSRPSGISHLPRLAQSACRKLPSVGAHWQIENKGAKPFRDRS
jgi:hypothetical protein